MADDRTPPAPAPDDRAAAPAGIDPDRLDAQLLPLDVFDPPPSGEPGPELYWAVLEDAFGREDARRIARGWIA